MMGASSLPMGPLSGSTWHLIISMEFSSSVTIHNIEQEDATGIEPRVGLETVEEVRKTHIINNTIKSLDMINKKTHTKNS